MVVVRFRQPDGGTVEVVFSTRGGGLFDPHGIKRAVVRPRLNLPVGFWEGFVGFVKEMNEKTGNRHGIEEVFEDMVTTYMAVTRAKLEPPPPPTPTTKKTTKPKEDKGTLIHDKKKGYRYKTEDDE